MRVEQREKPFVHWLVDGFLTTEHSVELFNSVPDADWTGWLRYDNDVENKRTSRDVGSMPSCWQELFCQLQSEKHLSWLRSLSSIPELVPDETLHGGGIHVCDRGGHLGSHVDYALHPHKCDMERRVNCILFLNSVWEDSWGGALCLFDDMGERAASKIYPRPGRMLIWLPTDAAYHGTEEVNCGIPRITAAVYYLAPARPGVLRKRALFVPNRGNR